MKLSHGDGWFVVAIAIVAVIGFGVAPCVAYLVGSTPSPGGMSPASSTLTQQWTKNATLTTGTLLTSSQCPSGPSGVPCYSSGSILTWTLTLNVCTDPGGVCSGTMAANMTMIDAVDLLPPGETYQSSSQTATTLPSSVPTFSSGSCSSLSAPPQCTLHSAWTKWNYTEWVFPSGTNLGLTGKQEPQAVFTYQTRVTQPDTSALIDYAFATYDYPMGSGPYGAENPSTPGEVYVPPPSITTALSPSTKSVTFGTTVTDTATLAGAYAPTGTITYGVYTDSLCTDAVPTGSGPGQYTSDVVSVSADGAQTASTPFTGLPSVGTYYWQAVYSGDINNTGVSSACTSEILTVTPATPTLKTTLGTASPLSLESTEYDTAVFGGLISGVYPTGTVSYYLLSGSAATSCPTATTLTGGTLVGTAVTIGSTGLIPNSAATASLTAGSYAFYAVYGGDSNYNGVTSACEPFTVNMATPTLTTEIEVTSPTASFYDSATFGGLGSGITPTGTVSYYLIKGSCNSTTVGSEGSLVGEPVTISGGTIPDSANKTLSTGNYAFYAVYSGDANYHSVTSYCEPFSVSSSSGNPCPDTVVAASRSIS